MAIKYVLWVNELIITIIVVCPLEQDNSAMNPQDTVIQDYDEICKILWAPKGLALETFVHAQVLQDFVHLASWFICGHQN